MGNRRPAAQTSTPARLPKPPGIVRVWLAAHPGVVNGTILVGYLLGSALMITLDIANGDLFIPFWFYLLICAAVSVALWWRTRAPMVGLVLTVVLGVFDVGNLHTANTVALVFFLYAVPVYRGVQAAWIGYAIVSLGNVLLVLQPQLHEGSPLRTDSVGILPLLIIPIISMSVWYLAVVVIGINMGNRRRYVAALLSHAEQLIRDQEQQAQLAVAEERARIAREMHDIIAHSLSVVVTLTEAAAVSIDTQPAAAKFAVQRASETGRNALSEMRRLLGVLDDPNAGSRAPQPQLSDVPELCTSFTEAGLRITLSESGVPHADAGHQIAVYRIVQEALTNALRYGGSGAEVLIDLQHTAAETILSVSDSGKNNSGMLPGKPIDEQTQQTGKAAQAAQAITGTGRGLAGARQRAEMYGGEITAGPHGAGWKVIARLPYPN